MPTGKWENPHACEQFSASVVRTLVPQADEGGQIGLAPDFSQSVEIVVNRYESPLQRHRRLMLHNVAIQSISLILLLFSMYREQRPTNPIAASSMMVPQKLLSADAKVSAGSGWVPVGITLPAERVVAIRAKRSLTLSEAPPVSAEGAAYTCGQHLATLQANERGDKGCLLPDAPYGALIGRVDNGEPFMVGEFGAIVLRKAGALSLTLNICCDDEATLGSFAVHVSVTPFHHKP